MTSLPVNAQTARALAIAMVALGFLLGRRDATTASR
ncbi:hypothetical protein SAMN05216219_2367 [Mycetocola miduiensis]|uniref:Uncharacterized protein n=1 Tax=Mycetocola miduiensis TaxID=995034 RepID=A0A1I5CE07_9MICO|nr:hypothetical protein SAMN05216219_2367 [Mycetocola miduiensis]